MEQDIDIFEYEWWTAFIGHILIMIVSLGLMLIFFNLYPLVHANNVFRLNVLIFLSLLILIFPLPHFIHLLSVPKRIIFKESNIVIVNPFNRSVMFSYESISRFVLNGSPQWSEPLKWFSSSSTQFKARMYFSNSSFKLLFDPTRLTSCSALLDTLRNKGLSNVIEENY